MNSNRLELIRDRHPSLPTDLDRRPHPADRGSLAEDAVAHEAAELRQEIEGLRRRLVNLPTIEQAKGVLIGFYGIDADAAFALLVRWSQHTNIKLHLLAADLVAAADGSPGQPRAGLHRFLDQLPRPGHRSPAAPGLEVVAVPA